MIRAGIVGYGNLGGACEKIIAGDEKFKLVGIFTRRSPSALSSPYNSEFFEQARIEEFKDKIDVLLICTGSANDVTELGVRLARSFNTVDSFDTHAKMAEYVKAMGEAATEHLSFVGIGWDPGLFSLERALLSSIMGEGVRTFWGRGVSQGHSEAIRRIDGVIDAKQYTVPSEDAVRLAYEGKSEGLTPRDMHKRECFVVANEGADKERIRRQIISMPNYFEPYDTTVRFVSEKEFETVRRDMSHAGEVIAVRNREGETQRAKFSLELSSNPMFTASVLTAYAKANFKMYNEGSRGVKTVLDIPVSALIPDDVDYVKRYV